MAKPALWIVAMLTMALLGCNWVSQGERSPAENEMPSPAVPPPPPAEAYLGKISPNVLAKMSRLPVMAPAYVPPGFVLADYRFQGAESYGLVYRNPKNQCFAIEYRRQPPPAEDRVGLETQAFDSPVFGRDRELYYSASASQSPDSADRPSQLFSQWLSKEDGAYRFAGVPVIGQNYPAQTLCQNVSLAEASKIITSIAALTASTTTK